MAAITWRNIEAPSMKEALLAGNMAQQSFTSGFDNLNKILQDRQALEEQNWQANQDSMKQGFLDALYGAKSMEELAALEQSGQLNQMMQGMAPQTRQALRGQDEQRRTDLMNQLTQRQQFTDAQETRKAQPIIDRLTVMANSEDVDLRNSAKAALGIYGDQGMVPNAGKLMGGFLDAERGFAQESRAVAEDNRSELRLKDQLLTSAAQREASRESIQTNRFNLERLQKEQERAESARIAQGILADTVFNMGVLGTREGDEFFNKQLSSIVTGEGDRERVREGIARFQAKNPDKPVPVAYALQLAAEHGNDLGWFQNNDTTRSLNTLYQDPTFLEQLGAYQQLQANALTGFRQSIPKPTSNDFDSFFEEPEVQREGTPLRPSQRTPRRIDWSNTAPSVLNPTGMRFKEVLLNGR